MWTSEQFIAAGFVNPKPTGDETRTHLYVKHSSAPIEAYDTPGYGGASDPMFRPIQLRAFRIGVNICHDMFFGLLSHRFQAAGANALIDLTGENVQPSKWRCVGRGRSVEVGGHFLCTMDHKEGRAGRGLAFGYNDGVELRPLESYARPDGTGGFHVYSCAAAGPTEPAVFARSYSPKRYTDITLGLASSQGDIRIHVEGECATLDGPRTGKTSNGWEGFDIRGRSLGVLAAPVATLWDPTMLYRRIPEHGAFDCHVVVYHAPSTPTEAERCQMLAALRAVEHRVAVVIIAGRLREVLQTDNYKKVQRMQEHDGVFGLTARNLGGTWTSGRNAIYERNFASYLKLL
jgi:hypothetical protein